MLFNDFFYFILSATAYNFADDNTLALEKLFNQELTGSLESECEVALFNENKLIVNPKFQAKLQIRKKWDHTNEIFKIGTKETEIASKENFLRYE